MRGADGDDGTWGEGGHERFEERGRARAGEGLVGLCRVWLEAGQELARSACKRSSEAGRDEEEEEVEHHLFFSSPRSINKRKVFGEEFLWKRIVGGRCVWRERFGTPGVEECRRGRG